MRKQVITIQINPVVLAEAWQYGKDQGIPAKQVAIERLIKFGLIFSRKIREDK